MSIISDERENHGKNNEVMFALSELDDIHETVKHYLNKKPEIIEDRQAFNELLGDCLHDKPLCVSLLMMAYDERIRDEAKTMLSCLN